MTSYYLYLAVNEPAHHADDFGYMRYMVPSEEVGVVHPLLYMVWRDAVIWNYYDFETAYTMSSGYFLLMDEAKRFSCSGS